MWNEDNHTLDTYDIVLERGEEYWWLYIGQCRICKKYLLIAQEERENDLRCILPLNSEQVTGILEHQVWPADFDTYETLLEIWYKSSR